MQEIDLVEWMKQQEKEMPLSWHIKMIPYKIWAKFYVFFNLTLPYYKYKIVELFCKHEYINQFYFLNKEPDIVCKKCGKLK